MAASPSVPIVFVWVADPVASGIVKSYARPGGNATGVSLRYFELAAKRLELVRELLPSARRIAVYSSVFDSQIESLVRMLREPADNLGFELVQADGRAGMRPAVDGAVRAAATALVMLDPLAVFGRLADAKDIAAYAIERRLPLVGTDIETCELGGLISYATNLNDDMRRAADLVARVLRGDKPAELPVDQAARFELVVNLGTARGIGMTVPQSILARADRVIE
jgi:putative ABC transport system substrate-binding protein